ncbi:regulator of sigma-W protease RasP [Oxobacter pfennigii]|uniref:Zinc metalloprotease n=1 Tax=Oxobacter pfennigii TaxID=36849 RepID=A0A0P8YAD5_9CLOT|nr:RIP metalloprotease RseP [Oxobacter pfennigii]KPU43910.1 regulator of sigma-W protease RasP [Oxobacter pfennigii]
MITLLAVVFVFGLLIMGHEFGHFIMAKLNNIKVLEFAFGMGPRLFKFDGKETAYSLRIFPIGGYVKMLGEEEEVNDPRSFSSKKTLAKMSVIAAGPIMNIIIAVVIFAIISMTSGYVKPIVSKLVDEYPAAKNAGILPGDRIIRVNGQKISTYEDYLVFVYENGGKPFNIVIDRNGDQKSFELNPIWNAEEERYMIGIEATIGRANILEALNYGVNNTWSFVKQIGGFFKNLIMGKASTEDVSGPVGIIKFAGDAARQGFNSLLVFTAFLSINLAIMNLIPFPALDGGWLFILVIEGLRRRRLDANKIGVVNFIGFAFLMILTVLITFRDFLRLSIF